MAKLRHDYDRLDKDPSDDFAAWDFFVTAEHMRDWIDRPGGASRPANTPLLKVVSHLANGGKHFELSPGRHDSVRDVSQVGIFDPRIFDGATFDIARLTVEVSDPSGIRDIIDLAREVIAYWEAQVAAKR